MGERFTSIHLAHREFVLKQQIVFIASAAAESRVNVSPKPAAALRLIDERTALYLDETGSGNETAAHMLADGRLTFMFCSFEGPPRILRLYGCGRVMLRNDTEYRDAIDRHYGGVETFGARHIIVLDVELVQTSCGYGVPLFSYVGERDTLERWAQAKGETGLDEYRRTKNVLSIDGLPTGILDTASG